MSESSNSRYAGKPLLRLLECYVLWSIGHLSESQQSTLKTMTPKLQAIYATSGEWQQIIEKAVGLEPSLPESIRQLWARNTQIAQHNGVTLIPQDFAEMFVDQNVVARSV
jgi:hypothetical protein